MSKMQPIWQENASGILHLNQNLKIHQAIECSSIPGPIGLLYPLREKRPVCTH
jgi:hypothetical protein